MDTKFQCNYFETLWKELSYLHDYFNLHISPSFHRHEHCHVAVTCLPSRTFTPGIFIPPSLLPKHVYPQHVYSLGYLLPGMFAPQDVKVFLMEEVFWKTHLLPFSLSILRKLFAINRGKTSATTTPLKHLQILAERAVKERDQNKEAVIKKGNLSKL